MKTKYIGVVILFIIALLSSACADRWRNKYTGDIMDGVPTYKECAQDVPLYVIDKSCWYSCNDYYYEKYGTSNPRGCDKECTRDSGEKSIISDHICNSNRAKLNGWYRQ